MNAFSDTPCRRRDDRLIVDEDATRARVRRKRMAYCGEIYGIFDGVAVIARRRTASWVACGCGASALDAICGHLIETYGTFRYFELRHCGQQLSQSQQPSQRLARWRSR